MSQSIEAIGVRVQHLEEGQDRMIALFDELEKTESKNGIMLSSIKATVEILVARVEAFEQTTNNLNSAIGTLDAGVATLNKDVAVLAKAAEEPTWHNLRISTWAIIILTGLLLITWGGTWVLRTFFGLIPGISP